MQARLIPVFALLLLAIAACAPQAAPTATPSPVPTEVPAPTEDVTPAPTMTAVPRPTLPPTWTPDFLPTATPLVGTLRPDETNVALRAQPTLPACATFAEDREQTPRTFVAGEPLTIYWWAAQGAIRYRVTLYDAALHPLMSEVTSETQYTFSGDYFELGNFYGWEVRPFDSIGAQLCLPIGDDVEGG
ncbi:MAG: hypothetical protein IT320_04620 [Anaerolineae bacterium]|nr:hypothetical protein [Anaerolineae bacterium]